MSEIFGLLTKDNIPVPLTGVEIRSDITGRGAHVEVTQAFHNAEETAVEAVYKFPLPENSAVKGFKVITGDRSIDGEIEERDKAFDAYDEALSQGHGAYLLDEERPNIFTLSVGNVNPGMSVIVRLSYVMLLEANDSEVRFFLPTTISPRYTPDNTKDKDGIPVDRIVNPSFALDVPYGLKASVNISGKNAIASVESPSHMIVTKYLDEMIEVEFSSEVVAMDRDFILNVSYRDGFENRCFACNNGNETFLQIDFSPKPNGVQTEGKPEQIPREFIFVLDCSGSMNGSSITEAKKALEILLKALNTDAMFNIYRFGSTYQKLFPACVHYAPDALKKAVSYVGGMVADLGGTEMYAPLENIYRSEVLQGYQRNIILITDGEISNESDIFRLVQGGTDTTKVFSVGIGHGPNEYFIRQIARLSHGASELISPNERIEPKVLRLFKKIISQEITGLKIESENEIDLAPFVPSAYLNETISLFGRLKTEINIPDALKLTGSIGGKLMEWSIPIEQIKDTASTIPILWAKEFIRDIEEGVRTPAGSKQAERKEFRSKEEIIHLSKTYGVISRETSFVAVEKREDKDKTLGEVVLRKVPVMLTKDWGGVERKSQYDSSTSFYIGVSDVGGAAMARDESPMFMRSGTESSSFLRKKVPTNQDIILKVLSLQQFEGGFEIDWELADMLNLSLIEIRKIAEKISGKYKIDKHRLICTAMILVILEKRFDGEKSQWETLAEKSRKWLELEIKAKAPVIDGVPIMDWVKNYLEN
ncbi:MAG: VIT domain-containing protein [Proteobacteria bacterium]|nr:VIT domain-containing protein [Pseudomonadota bacterium]